ncbi:MAG: hypothetical protein RIB79_06555 [Allomuricauda sp.]
MSFRTVILSAVEGEGEKSKLFLDFSVDAFASHFEMTFERIIMDKY